MDPIAIDQLASAYRDGRHDALPPLVHGLARTLLAQAFRFVRDWDQAADLVQDTWLRATSSMTRYDSTRPFLPWLRTILRNCCLQFLAQERRRPEPVSLVTVGDPMSTRPSDQTDQALCEHDLRRRVARHLTRLPESQRQAVVMVDLEDTPQDETARVLGVTPDSLRVILHRGRRALAERLDKEDAS